MATLGNATGTVLSAWPKNYVEVAGPYTATENGTITGVTMKVSGNNDGDLGFRAVVYIDSAGVPGALVATSAESMVLSAQGAGEVTLAVSSGSIVNGSSYWIGFEIGNGTTAHIVFYVKAGPSKYVASATYPTAPDPFGSGSDYTDQFWAYIVYTPGGGAANKGSFFGLMA